MHPLTRRALLGNTAKGGLTLGTGALVASCGTSSSSTTSRSQAGAATPRHGGTLLVGMTGGTSADTLDPNIPTSNPNIARFAQLYDPLVGLTTQGQPDHPLAEEMTPNKDATVWTVRLRSGVTFHNGKELTADDLIFTFKRAVNPKNPGAAAAPLATLEMAKMKKLDKYTLELPFTKPFSTLVDMLVELVYIVPDGFDLHQPVGTGPFQYVSFNPGQQSVFRRNPNYWTPPLPYVDKLVITDYPDETSQVNALLSGQAAVVNGLSAETSGTVNSSGQTAFLSPGGGFTPFTMRTDVAPFNDVRVRQAFRLAIDREKMLATVFENHGTIGNDVPGIWDTGYDHSLPQHAYDPEQARSLLKAAGHASLNVTLVTANIASGAGNMAQVFAQQATASGIKVTLRQLTPTAFFGPNYLKWTFAQDVWGYVPYISYVAQSFLPTSAYNDTHFNDPTYTKLYNQALATTDLKTRTGLYHEMQMIEHSQGGWIIPFFPNLIDGYRTNVHGAVPTKTGESVNLWDFKSLWLS
jgi:peptide/nickel transport system substrate-binding protein